ncbi:MAG: PIN domain-containing protein [Candidatus Nanohaloarchaea archaeon]|nr:PIN domain-containing protein [Candidatus Nanohaloarchaea archaeon]
MILDTSFLVDVLRGKDAVKPIETEIDEGQNAAVTSVTVMELWQGIREADDHAAERDAVEILLSQFPTQSFSSAAARVAGEIQADLKEAGVRIDAEDVMIGAIARHRAEPVVTADPDHFEQIPGLTVRSY